MVDQLLEDLQTVGIADERIIVKADQGSAIVDVQKAVAKARIDPGTQVLQERLQEQMLKSLRNVRAQVRPEKFWLQIGFSVRKPIRNRILRSGLGNLGPN